MANFLTGDSSILSYIGFIIMIFLYQKVLFWQIIWKLESDLKEIDMYRQQSEKYVLSKISKNPDKRVKESVSNFMNFFISPPVDIDPYGIMKKIEHIMNESERRFAYFVDHVAPDMSKEERANLRFALIGAIGVNQIYKIVRHLLITIKKTNNFPYASMFQMMMPQIMKLAKSNTKATKAFSEGVPIGDAIGPIVAASLKTIDMAVAHRTRTAISRPTLLDSMFLRWVKLLQARNPCLITTRSTHMCSFS